MGSAADTQAATLRQVLAQVKLDRDAEIEQIKRAYEEKIKPIERAIAALTSTNGNSAARRAPKPRRSSPSPDAPGVLKLEISEDKLNTLRADLKKHPRSRQADLVRRTGLNSGSVSVGLRVLKERGEVKDPGVQDNGSRVWEWVTAKSRNGRQKAPAAA